MQVQQQLAQTERTARLSSTTDSPDIDLRWHVMLTEPQREARAAKRLRELGFAPYFPSMPHRKLRVVSTIFGQQRRPLMILLPLFPGYLFLPLNMAWSFGPIYRASGLRTHSPFLIVDGRHARVSDRDIASMREIEAELRGQQQAAGLPFKAGDRVRVTHGPLQDFVGKISRMSDAERIELLMDVVGGKTRVLTTWRQIALEQ
jgi:transcription antitermination factor NusG